MLAEEYPARREGPLVSTSKVTDQNVEMHDGASGTTPGRGAFPAPGRALERKPLAMRRRLQRDPARIPFDRRPAQEACPEPGQIPRIRAVQHDLAYPADRAIVISAHQHMMNDASLCTGLHAQTSSGHAADSARVQFGDLAG